MTKIMTVVGTRPEIIRLSRVIAKFEGLAAQSEYVEHVLVHTGQNYDYELNQIFFEELGLRKPDYFLSAAGDTPAATVGKVIIEIDKVFEKEQPDALVLLGDTNSCMAVIAAKRRKIPIFHMEAGNRCFDQRVPEEVNRKVIDHLSDINLPYSDIAREHLIREGIPSGQIIKLGSPMYEVLSHYRPGIDGSSVLRREGLIPREFFLVSLHREENQTPQQIKKFIDVLNTLAWNYKFPVIVSTHPRTAKSIGVKRYVDPLVWFMKPFGFFDYVHLQMSATAVLSDSGTITEESSILSFPAITLRGTQERPEGMEESTVMMTGLDTDRVLDALKIVSNTDVYTKLVADYYVPNYSDKVVRTVLSYIDYVNTYVWHKGAL